MINCAISNIISSHQGSGWTINLIMQHHVVISEIVPDEGNPFFSLPKVVGNSLKGVANIQKEKDKCFRWCFIRYLNSANKAPTKIRNDDKDFAKQLNFKSVKFAVHKKNYAAIENQNDISINVFRYENKTRYHIYTSNRTFENHVDLLLLSNSKNS